MQSANKRGVDCCVRPNRLEFAVVDPDEMDRLLKKSRPRLRSSPAFPPHCWFSTHGCYTSSVRCDVDGCGHPVRRRGSVGSRRRHGRPSGRQSRRVPGRLRKTKTRTPTRASSSCGPGLPLRGPTNPADCLSRPRWTRDGISTRSLSPRESGNPPITKITVKPQVASDCSAHSRHRLRPIRRPSRPLLAISRSKRTRAWSLGTRRST